MFLGLGLCLSRAWCPHVGGCVQVSSLISTFFCLESCNHIQKGSGIWFDISCTASSGKEDLRFGSSFINLPVLSTSDDTVAALCSPDSRFDLW